MNSEVPNQDPQNLLDGLLTTLEDVKFNDFSALDGLIRRTEMIIRNIFGGDSKYINDLNYMHFSPMVVPASHQIEMSSWQSGCNSLKNLIQTMKEELALFGAKVPSETETPTAENASIFIVHGHDETMKVTVARVIEKLGLNTVILHEKPNKGRTIIEKFSDYSAVGFAIILLSPDDVGKLRTAPPEEMHGRARQNVIFELGYFIGRLGRERVVALYKGEDNFEFPSDYSGVLYVPFDATGRWQFDVVKELKAVGYEVDANKLLDAT